jgi:hypothetical protein
MRTKRRYLCWDVDVPHKTASIRSVPRTFSVAVAVNPAQTTGTGNRNRKQISNTNGQCSSSIVHFATLRSLLRSLPYHVTRERLRFWSRSSSYEKKQHAPGGFIRVPRYHITGLVQLSRVVVTPLRCVLTAFATALNDALWRVFSTRRTEGA